MDLKVYTLISSSSGNSIFFRYKSIAFLIDAGRSMKVIKQNLEAIGESLDSISAIFVTHEHSDHIKAIPMIKKHYPDIPVIIPKACYIYSNLASDIVTPYTNSLCMRCRDEDITVCSIKTSHDSADSVGYVISTPEGNIGICTDTGYIPEESFKKLASCKGVLIESNYDEKMLACGSYPPELKDRIRSNRGHLSNDYASKCVETLCRYGTENFLLCHLSEENNTPEAAYSNAKKILSENSLSPSIKVAQKDKPTSLF